jgi:DNA-binding NarL/FixJ family response regulator
MSLKRLTTNLIETGYNGRMAVAISVSIVEDDPQTREILAEWIASSRGFRLAGECQNGERALALLPETKPDVVLMDINLPGISGVEGVKLLKRMLPATQFVMLTVYEDTDYIYNALAAGATGYLLKQTSKEELLSAVEDVYRGGSPMNSRIARKVVQFFGQTPAAVAAGEALSPREEEVLGLLARGYLYKEIASNLSVSVPTVNTYVRRVYEKLHVRTRGQAIAKYAHITGAEKGPLPRPGKPV